MASSRYVGLGKAIMRVLGELGGRAEIDDVLERVWREYVAGGGSGRVVMRLYRHPSGELWSPDADEAIRILEAAGVIERRGRVLLVRARVRPSPRG